MTDVLNAPDRFWERLKVRFRALRRIDSGADWQTWIHHAVITVLVGQLIGWLVPFVSGTGGMRFMVFVYLCREVANVYDRRRLRLPLKPLDHVMDVLLPFVVCELVAWAMR